MKKTSQKKDANKAIIFDSGVLISFSMNGITRILKELKSVFNGKFLITPEIKKEVIDIPIKIKKFELEALKIKRLLDDGVLEMPSSLGIKDSEIMRETDRITKLANTCFYTRERDIHLLDPGEASCLALSVMLKERGIKNVLAIDERTTRMLAEKHENLREFLEKKLHVRISINHESVKFFANFNIIRSPELAYVAWKKGLVDLKDGPTVLDALLYALKFKGSSISGEEIEEIKRIK